MKVLYARSRKQIEFAAQIIRRDGLCYHDGAIRLWCKKPENILGITLAKLNGEYIGCAIVINELDMKFSCNVGVYVLRRHRKKGIGRALLNSLKEKLNVELVPQRTGTNGNFYEKCGV